MMTISQNDLHDRSRIFAEDTRAEGSPPYPHKQPESQRVWGEVDGGSRVLMSHQQSSGKTA
jgi:hypothetical protein